MAQAGRIAAWALRLVGEAVEPGISTAELDAIAMRAIRSRGATPTFLGYEGFPASICASINNEIVHGIPSPQRILREGDIISIDLGATYKGWVADNAWTYPVGTIDPQTEELLAVGQQCLWNAINQARVGNCMGDIGAAVEEAAGRYHRGIVKNYTGHGVGHTMHESPSVPNYGRHGRGLRLEEGLVIAIEPMICAGTGHNKVGRDGWLVTTRDGKPAVHFEKTVALTADGPRVLTCEPQDQWSIG